MGYKLTGRKCMHSYNFERLLIIFLFRLSHYHPYSKTALQHLLFYSQHPASVHHLICHAHFVKLRQSKRESLRSIRYKYWCATGKFFSHNYCGTMNYFIKIVFNKSCKKRRGLNIMSSFEIKFFYLWNISMVNIVGTPTNSVYLI